MVNRILSYFTFWTTLLILSELACCMHCKRRKFFWIVLPVSVVGYVWFTRWLFLELIRGMTEPLMITLCMGYFVLSCAVLFALFKMDISESLFIGSIGYTIQNSLHHAKNIIKVLFFDGKGRINYTITQIIVNAVVILVLGYLISRFILKNKAKYSFGTNFLISAVTAVLVCFVSRIMDKGGSNSVYVSTYGIIMCVSLLVLQALLAKFFTLYNENEVARRIIAEQEKHRIIAQDNIAIINQKCHDLKHQIGVLRNMGASKERDAVIGELENAVIIYDNIVKTDNEMLNALLYEKSLYCKSNGIEFTCLLNTKNLNFIDTLDLYTLLANALDNAIEAVLKEPPDFRFITFKISCVGNLIKIFVENNVSGSVVFKDGVPVTTKADKNYHGYGTLSMQQITDKNGGNIVWTQKENTFAVSVMLPINPQSITT